ncbi:MAG: molybdenum cofactor biosynthesis protein MoaE [Legionella sp.]|nr:molybdenum cofactor biosynthesis protein MoaE [Legionella sp.]
MCNDHKDITVEILEGSMDIMSIYQSFFNQMHPRTIGMLIGYVDHHNKDKEVKGITYDMHVSMAEKTLLKIAKEAQHFFDKDIGIYAAHTKGYIPSGGLCTLVQVSARNFKIANEVCAFMGDEIKKRLPIWKYEHYTDGTNEWLPGQFQLSKPEPKHKMSA